MTRPKVLIADDDQQFLTSLTLRLTNAGYDVTEANDGMTAIKLAAQIKPDLLVLDVHMPSGDGFAAIEIMDRHDSLHTLPVIYVTGDQTDATSANAVRHGAMAVLRKPLDMAQFLETVALLTGNQTDDTFADTDLRGVA